MLDTEFTRLTGCRIGTRFVCTREANAHEHYKRSLVAASAEDTVYTQAFSVMWPDAPHRDATGNIAALVRPRSVMRWRPECRSMLGSI